VNRRDFITLLGGAVLPMGTFRIVAAAPPAVQAAAAVTTSIPVIAIDLESDPVASGFLTLGRAERGHFRGLPPGGAYLARL